MKFRILDVRPVLALETGPSCTTLSRTFARLRSAGLLEVDGATLRLPDRAALEDRFRRLLGEE
ncbi:MAG: helix-turn-helix domain-containing protein [Opitutaceae bacterium]